MNERLRRCEVSVDDATSRSAYFHTWVEDGLCGVIEWTDGKCEVVPIGLIVFDPPYSQIENENVHYQIVEED